MQDHSLSITANGRAWLEENDNKRLPLDYEKYPGKMDHATCVCFRASSGDIPIWNIESNVEKLRQREAEEKKGEGEGRGSEG